MRTMESLEFSKVNANPNKIQNSPDVVYRTTFDSYLIIKKTF